MSDVQAVRYALVHRYNTGAAALDGVLVGTCRTESDVLCAITPPEHPGLRLSSCVNDWPLEMEEVQVNVSV